MRKLRYYIEKAKTIFLAFLMIFCIVQIGILWIQSSSIPIAFLKYFMPNENVSFQTSVEEIKDDFLLPFRVAVSVGFDDDHYIVPNGSGIYRVLWGDAKIFLGQALQSKPRKLQPYEEDVWGKLVAQKPFAFEFKTQVPIDVFKWVLGLKESAGEGLEGIYKIAICPSDPDNGNLDTLYIRDNTNIYTYDVHNAKTEMMSKDIVEIISSLSQNRYAKNYQVTIERFRSTDENKTSQKIAQDMFCPTTQKSIEEYPDIQCTPLSGVLTEKYEVDDLSKTIFGKESMDYDPDEDMNGAAVFKKTDSVFKLYNNSILEYRYIANPGVSEKPRVLEAYKNAISFIIEHSNNGKFLSGISLYLKAIEQQKSDTFVFKFDYSVEVKNSKEEVIAEAPILIDNYIGMGADRDIDSGISIEASSKRVVNCQWLVYTFRTAKTQKYEWFLVDLLEKLEIQNPGVVDEDFSADNVGIYYVLSSPQDKTILPKSVLFSKDKIYDVGMKVVD